VFKNVPIDQAIEITEFEEAYRTLPWKRIPLPASSAKRAE